MVESKQVDAPNEEPAVEETEAALDAAERLHVGAQGPQQRTDFASSRQEPDASEADNCAVDAPDEAHHMPMPAAFPGSTVQPPDAIGTSDGDGQEVSKPYSH